MAERKKPAQKVKVVKPKPVPEEDDAHDVADPARIDDAPEAVDRPQFWSGRSNRL